MASIQHRLARHGLLEALVDGCAAGVVNARKEPVLKRWRFITSSARLASELGTLRCPHEPGFKHGELQGGHDTKKTGFYPDRLCRVLLSGLFGSHTNTPMMPCSPIPSGEAPCPHREISLRE